jgi:hypothetical protein
VTLAAATDIVGSCHQVKPILGYCHSHDNAWRKHVDMNILGISHAYLGVPYYSMHLAEAVLA